MGHWIAEYGYAAVFIGCLLEGETILILAGFAAHEGQLSLPLTIFIAFVAGTLGDQIFYGLGRCAGRPCSIESRTPRIACVESMHCSPGSTLR